MREELLEGALEGILLVAHEPIPVEHLVQALEGAADRVSVEAALARIEARLAQGRGWHLQRVAGGVRLATRPEVEPYVRAFLRRRRERRLSRAALEVLAVVAYRQPCTAGDLQEIRGVDCSGVLRTLLDRGLIRTAGRRRVPGRPLLYATTEAFLEQFGLESLDDLPSWGDLEELFGEESRQMRLFETPSSEGDGTDEAPEAGEIGGEEPPVVPPEGAPAGEVP